jgi:hypothetical protein
LAGELAHAGGLVGAAHADIDPGEPDGPTGAGHAPDVVELAQDSQRDQLADSDLAHQHLAAGLAAREAAQPSLDLMDLTLERVDHAKRDRDPLAGVIGKRQAVEETAAVRSRDPSRRARADPMVVKDRADPHKPPRALVDQCFCADAAASATDAHAPARSTIPAADPRRATL